MVDPDGRAFYVYVGELSELSASLTLSMENKAVSPLATKISSESDEFDTSAWEKVAEGSSYTLTITDESGADVTQSLGISASNFQFKDKDGNVISVLLSNGQVNRDKATEARTVEMVNVAPDLLKDDVTYTAKITVTGYSNSAAILAEAVITFTKKLPEFPSNIAPFTNMFDANNNVMIFPTAGENNSAIYDMTNVWHNLETNSNATTLIDNSSKKVVTYSNQNHEVSIAKSYVNPEDDNYGKAIPMDVEYNYGYISNQLNTTTGKWEVVEHKTYYGGFNVIFGNYVKECNVTFDSKFEQTYPGAVGKECYIPLSSLTIKDWYNASVDLTKIGTSETKENTYIKEISGVHFITDNAAKPVDEYYKFEKFAYQSKSGKYFKEGDTVADDKDTNNNGKTVTMAMCNTIVMTSTSSASTGSTVQTKIRFTIVDKFGYTIDLTSENSFPMKFQE